LRIAPWVCLLWGSEDYGKRIRRMSESGALFHRARRAIHPQGFKRL